MKKIITIGLLNRIILLVFIGMVILIACNFSEAGSNDEKVASTWTEYKGMYSGSFQGVFDNSAGKDLQMTANIWQDTSSAMLYVEILQHGHTRPNIPSRSFINAWINPGYPSSRAIELYYINGVFLDKSSELARALASDTSDVVLHISLMPNRLLEYFISLPPFPDQDNAVLSIGYGKAASPQEWALLGK